MSAESRTQFVEGTESVTDGDKFIVAPFLEAIVNASALKDLGLSPEDEGVTKGKNGDFILNETAIEKGNWLNYLGADYTKAMVESQYTWIGSIGGGN